MTTTLRIILFVISIAIAYWTLQKIRKAAFRIEDSVFWIIFSGGFALMALFPGILELCARVVGVYSALNFLFLSVSFILLIKLYRTTIRLSQVESKMQMLVQRYAIDHNASSFEEK